MELAYTDTNLNSGGCGATSGITWPVDRTRMAELLGFDGIVEPCYDAEASQDHSMSILFGLSNICLLISKTAMDMNIWGMEEIDMLKTDYSWCGVSSMMPNKCIPGSLFERARIEAGYVIGQMMQAATLIKGEPHGDMLPMLEPPKIACHAMAHAVSAIGYMRGLLKNIVPQKAKMLAYVREGFSCSSEVAAYMVKELDYGPRRAHRIVATMVRFARERNLKAFECTSELLDEAAVFAEEEKPAIDTPTLRRLLDPEHFIQTHCHRGGTAPREALRLLADRRAEAQGMRQRQEQRKAGLQQGRERLKTAIDAVVD
jgi:argininosuccinate lyase